MTINSAYLLDSVAVLRSIGLHLKGEYFLRSFFLCELTADFVFTSSLPFGFWLLAFQFQINVALLNNTCD